MHAHAEAPWHLAGRKAWVGAAARRYSRVWRCLAVATKGRTLATPNYSYEKRQRELAKKRKAEEKAAEKRARKLQGRTEEGAPADGTEPTDPASDQAPPQEA